MVLLQVVLRLDKYFFADDETLKSIASHLMLEQFGESYDDAMFLDVRPDLHVCLHVLQRSSCAPTLESALPALRF